MFDKPWENHPTELPDGRLVCPHGLVTCGICTVDYSFMEEVLGEDESDSDVDMNHDDDEERSESSDSDEQVRFAQLQPPTGQPSGVLGYEVFEKYRDASGREEYDLSEFGNGGQQIWPPIGKLGMPSKRPIRRPKSPPPGSELITCDRFEDSQGTDPPWRLFNHDEGNFRFSRKANGKDEVLIYTDGACLDNGSVSARGGCAFVFQPEDTSQEPTQEYVNFALEKRGPTGVSAPATSNRAELRAVIAALKFRQWQGEGWDRIVIATDSSYAVDGITEHMMVWFRRNWRNAKGKPVMNRDLWQALLDRVRELHKFGAEVVFWRIPRAWNSKADLVAKAAAQQKPLEEYTKRSGIYLSTSRQCSVVTMG